MDLLFDSATVTATSIDHGSVFNDTTNPDVIVTGLVDDLGGATTDLGRAVGPNWALLARVPVTVTGSGPFTFSLNHGAFAFALAEGSPPLVNAEVNVTETLSVDVVVVDDGVNCTSDSCDEVNHVAIHTPNDASCNNGLFCDGDETCDASLDCQAGTAPVIDDGVGCTDDSCDEVNDVIVRAVNDGLCDNGQFCDGVETCDVTQDCQAGTTPVIDDGVACTDDSCDETNDVVVHTPNDGFCDNTLFCDGVETCDASLDCQAGTAPVIDDGVGCTDDSCDETNDVIVNAANDANCSNGLFCDGTETCDAISDCQAGTAPVIDDGVTCTDDSCDEVNDVIVHAVNDSLCDNGQFCDGDETCDASLDCQAGTAPTIDDGVTCTDDSCDEVNAIIVNTPNDTNCNDSIVCTTDVCDLVFDCVNSALIYDLDESNLVDFSDFALFAPRFATFAGDLDYDACSDFYFDDVIDAADVSFFGTAFGKTCDDTTIVTPDTGHLPPLGCPAGPLGVLAAVEKDGDSVTLEVNAVVVVLPSLFTSSDTFPVSHTDPIGIRSAFVVEVWVRMSGETAMGITGGSLNLHIDPELATPISASVDDGFPWFQGGEIDASTGSVINLSGGTLQTGAAVGEWVRFASVEFMSHHPGARSLDLVQGHMVFAQYAVGAMAPEAVTLTGTQITIEVIKRQRRSHREGG